MGRVDRHFGQEGKDRGVLRDADGCHRQAVTAGGSLFGIEHSNEGLITFPGGLPIVDEHGVLVGAIGVSGSSVENDEAVAKAGVDVLGVAELPEHPWRT